MIWGGREEELLEIHMGPERIVWQRGEAQMTMRNVYWIHATRNRKSFCIFGYHCGASMHGGIPKKLRKLSKRQLAKYLMRYIPKEDRNHPQGRMEE